MENTVKNVRSGDDRNLIVIGAESIQAILDGKEHEIVEIVSGVYQAHARGESSLPHSQFLQFPENAANRIIALPAYLGGTMKIAGLKWISSFPANVDRGLDRASSALILNSMETGQPKAILEGSIISAKRTAASAALAARVVARDEYRAVGMIGCGVINFEIAKFLISVFPEIHTLISYDLSRDRMSRSNDQYRAHFQDVQVEAANDLGEVLERASLLSFATTAREPYLYDLSTCAPGTVILHVSLRDLSPETILSSDNIVDDIDHVSRAQTSIHLTEQKTGSRNFIRCTLGEILNGNAPPRRDDHSVVIFSPFGLGILDLALGDYTLRHALQEGEGEIINDFIPAPWNRSAIGSS
jgi:N-[(2S)-2-amino-2-carboxyethyl]-L-glutamate dehydrogenase